jgi:hypothetical protein
MLRDPAEEADVVSYRLADSRQFLGFKRFTLVRLDWIIVAQ